MSDTKFEAARKKALELRFAPVENNIEKADKLLRLKAGVLEKYWEYEDICRKKESEFIILDEVQEGKNKEVRDAKLELVKSSDTDFDILSQYKRVLRVISSVEQYNDVFIKLSEV